MHLFMSVFLCFAVTLHVSVQSVLAAAAFSGSNLFIEPFRLLESSDHRGIYSIRLDLHLYPLYLRNYRVEEIDKSSLTLRGLENQLRHKRSLRRFLHLGPAEGNRDGFVVGFPLAPELGLEHDLMFALVAAHSRADDFPVFTLHGLARVTDFDKHNIEGGLGRVSPPFNHVFGAGDVLSMEEVYVETLAHQVL
ncbi:conserved hypothetical Ustilaginaceae-specific protein [Sporisorium reilianum SRZ2]|uniref:Conserved hypothetical Ustilaginaceae-specific protein n=1 Tax=Sporisorium reilianum (strain SRZ2) TaxID=999809 RepID=E6ZS65_SPORE|nr:conserved hypothetical Ustilaginaceae-specific protein [Sporisorium reilianum SRZ2]